MRIIFIVIAIVFFIAIIMLNVFEEDTSRDIELRQETVGRTGRDVREFAIAQYDYKTGVSGAGIGGEVKQGFDPKIEFDKETKIFRRWYLPAIYRTKVVVTKGKVAMLPYAEEGPTYEKGEVLVAGQEQTRTIEIE